MARGVIMYNRQRIGTHPRVSINLSSLLRHSSVCTTKRAMQIAWYVDDRPDNPTKPMKDDWLIESGFLKEITSRANIP